MITGKYLSIEDNLENVISIRNTVFDEEIKKDSSYINEALDAFSIHALVKDENDNYVGSGRLTMLLDDDNNTLFTMDLVGVLKDYQHKGYGEFMVRMLADKAMLSGAEYIDIKCPKEIEGFFSKLFFKTISEENGICNMKVTLSEFKHPCECCK